MFLFPVSSYILFDYVIVKRKGRCIFRLLLYDLKLTMVSGLDYWRITKTLKWHSAKWGFSQLNYLLIIMLVNTRLCIYVTCISCDPLFLGLHEDHRKWGRENSNLWLIVYMPLILTLIYDIGCTIKCGVILRIEAADIYYKIVQVYNAQHFFICIGWILHKNKELLHKNTYILKVVMIFTDHCTN